MISKSFSIAVRLGRTFFIFLFLPVFPGMILNLFLFCFPPQQQVQGHEGAKLDPLGLDAWRPAIPPPELDPKFHGFEAKWVLYSSSEIENEKNPERHHRFLPIYLEPFENTPPPGPVFIRSVSICSTARKRVLALKKDAVRITSSIYFRKSVLFFLYFYWKSCFRGDIKLKNSVRGGGGGGGSWECALKMCSRLFVPCEISTESCVSSVALLARCMHACTPRACLFSTLLPTLPTPPIYPILFLTSVTNTASVLLLILSLVLFLLLILIGVVTWYVLFLLWSWNRDMDRKLNLTCSASGGNTGYLEELGRQPTVSQAVSGTRSHGTYHVKMEMRGGKGLRNFFFCPFFRVAV